MKTNMNDTDRLIRTAAAATFIVLYFNGIVTGIWGIALIVLAIIFTLTAVVGYCPLYNLFHLNTRTHHHINSRTRKES
jgi:hypothetical protein